MFYDIKSKTKTDWFVYLCRLFSTLTIFSRETMSNWYDPDHLSDGKVRDISVHEEHPDDWDCAQPIEHSNALRKESSGREEKTCQLYQQKWQAFSRQNTLCKLHKARKIW